MQQTCGRGSKLVAAAAALVVANSCGLFYSTNDTEPACGDWPAASDGVTLNVFDGTESAPLLVETPPYRCGPYSSEQLVVDFNWGVSDSAMAAFLRDQGLIASHTFEGENSVVATVDRSAHAGDVNARDLAYELRIQRSDVVRFAEPVRLYWEQYDRAFGFVRHVYLCSTELLLFAFDSEDIPSPLQVQEFADEHCLIPADVSDWPASYTGLPRVLYYWTWPRDPYVVVYELDRTSIPFGALADEYAAALESDLSGANVLPLMRDYVSFEHSLLKTAE